MEASPSLRLRVAVGSDDRLVLPVTSPTATVAELCHEVGRRISSTGDQRQVTGLALPCGAQLDLGDQVRAVLRDDDLIHATIGGEGEDAARDRESATGRALSAEAQARAAARIARANAQEAMDHADRTDALMNVLVASQQEGGDDETLVAITDAVCRLLCVSVVNIFFVDHATELGATHMSWMYGTHECASPLSIASGSGLVGSLAEMPVSDGEVPFLYFAVTPAVPGAEQSVPLDLSGSVRSGTVDADELPDAFRASAPLPQGLPRPRSHHRVRNKTSEWLEEARLASLARCSSREFDRSGDGGEDEAFVASVDAPQAEYVSQYCSSPEDRARWASMWHEDTSIARLHMDHGVQAEHIMCMGITWRSKLVGVLQIMNKVASRSPNASPEALSPPPQPVFTASDRRQAETFCSFVANAVWKQCERTNFAIAMQQDEYMARTFSNTPERERESESENGSASGETNGATYVAGHIPEISTRGTAADTDTDTDTDSDTDTVAGAAAAAAASSLSLVETYLSISVERPMADLLPDTDALRQWGFPAMNYTIQQLVGCTLKIFDDCGLLNEGGGDVTVGDASPPPPCGCSRQAMEAFAATMLLEVYRNVPYHNAWHAFTTMQCVHTLLHPANSPELSGLLPEEIFSALVAALSHDAGHTGHNNDFHVNASNAGCTVGPDAGMGQLGGMDLAFLYNDQSTLENMHAHLCFATARREGCDIFSQTKRRGTYKVVRRCIITQILNTGTQQRSSSHHSPFTCHAEADGATSGSCN